MLTLQKTSQCTVLDLVLEKKHVKELTQRKKGGGDLKITVNGSTTSVHRKILMSCSDYFKSMFSAGFAESDADSIDLSEAVDSVTVLDDVLDSMYNGQISLSSKNITSMVNLASHFLFAQLQTACVLFLKVNMSAHTCIPTLNLAEMYNLTDVQGACLEVLRAWFMFGLDRSPEALQMPPQCLKLLAAEGILDRMPQQRRVTFLQKWHELFNENSDKGDEIPEQIALLLKENGSTPQPEIIRPEPTGLHGSQHGAGAHITYVDVLYTVFTPPHKGEEQCETEVHAFIESTNQWKFIVRHKFGKAVKQEAVPHLVGITGDMAYFMFTKDHMVDNNDPEAEGEEGEEDPNECIISVNLSSGSETLIALPDDADCRDQRSGYGGWAHYFMWQDHLCGIFRRHGYWRRNADEGAWSLFKYSQSGVWDELTRLYAYSGGEFFTIPLQDSLYIWQKEYMVCGAALAGYDYAFSKLSKSSDGDEYKLEALEPVYKCDSEDGDFPESDYSVHATVSYNSQLDTLHFIHNSYGYDDDGDVMEYSWDSLECKTFTYNISKNCWADENEFKVDYPEVKSCIAKPAMDTFRTKTPMMHPTKRMVQDDDDDMDWLNPQNERYYPETLVGACYYLKTTSPFNTTLWKLNAEKEEWTELTHLPYSLERFPYFQTGILNQEVVLSKPDSTFSDFSKEIGQSPAANLELLANDMKCDFHDKLVPQESYDEEWSNKYRQLNKTNQF